MNMRLHAMAPSVILLLGCLGLLRNQAQRRMPLEKPLTTVLPTMEGYTARDQKVTDEERAVAGMTEYTARAYSLRAAADLYGNCSTEYKAVRAAWTAVNVAGSDANCP